MAWNHDKHVQHVNREPIQCCHHTAKSTKTEKQIKNIKNHYTQPGKMDLKKTTIMCNRHTWITAAWSTPAETEKHWTSFTGVPPFSNLVSLQRTSPWTWQKLKHWLKPSKKPKGLTYTKYRFQESSNHLITWVTTLYSLAYCYQHFWLYCVII